MNDISDCPICLNTLQKDLSNNYINIAITSCGHIFCLACIVEHSKRSVSCPLCRNEFLDPNFFGIQIQEEIIETDMPNDWIFTSWSQQLRDINERSIQIMGRNGNSIPITNLSLDLDSPSLFGALTSEYFADTEDTFYNNVVATEFIEPEPESEPEPENAPEPEPYFIIYETNNQIYDYALNVTSSEDSDNEN